MGSEHNRRRDCDADKNRQTQLIHRHIVALWRTLPRGRFLRTIWPSLEREEALAAVLGSHQLQIALLQPQIAPNTGNIGRLCVATGTHLHLVRPMGFVLSDKNLRRSVMDYWPRLQHTVHDDTESFFAAMLADPGRRFWLFTTKATRSHWDVQFSQTDTLVFGSETHGIAEEIRERWRDRTVRIPQVADERCLNLATAAGIALYEALRQIR